MSAPRYEQDENLTTEQDERATELLAEAADLIEKSAPQADELVTKLRGLAFEFHQRLDPHCSCNDCMADFIERQG